MFELILGKCQKDPGSGSGFQNSDLLDPDPEPDPAENGPDPQPCYICLLLTGKYFSRTKGTNVYTFTVVRGYNNAYTSFNLYMICMGSNKAYEILIYHWNSTYT